METIEKIVYLYLLGLYTIFITALIAALTVGPVVLGLVLDHRWFFGYIVTAVAIPFLLLMVSSLKELFELYNELY